METIEQLHRRRWREQDRETMQVCITVAGSGLILWVILLIQQSLGGLYG